MVTMNGSSVTGLVRRCGSLGFSLFVLAGLICPFSAKADTNSLALINETGSITAYTGTDIKIGELESGNPASNNLALGNQIAFTTNLLNGVGWTPTAHATAVDGVMVSTNANDPGVAPGATVYSVALSTNGMPGLSRTAIVQNYISSAYYLATQQNVRVINESFGGGPTTLGTDTWSVGIDRLVAATGVTFVQSAGNSGTLGANSIGPPGAAYNVITVGAVNNAYGGAPTNVANYSSRGYLGNTRSEPDIVAPGGGGTAASNVEMPTYPVGTPATNTTFAYAGTSFAAPHVSGVVAQLMQYGNTLGGASVAAEDPRTIKAVLMNSATKLQGWQQGTVNPLTGFTTGTVTQVTQPLDPNQGAGLLNANGAYLQLAAGRQGPTVWGTGGYFGGDGQVGLTGWDLDSVDMGPGQAFMNQYELGTEAGGTVALTLVWNRDIGPTVGGTNNILGLANLTLNLYTSTNNLYTSTPLIAQSISGYDNIEHLWFTNLPDAYYDIGVGYTGYTTNYAAGVTWDTFTNQYALAWNFTAVPEPGSFLLAGLGITSLLWSLKRRRRT